MSNLNNEDTRMTPGVVLVSLLLTWIYFTPYSSVSIVDFEQANAGWDEIQTFCASKKTP